MRVQWKRFRRLLGGATGLVWLMTSAGVIFIGGEEESEWFYARMALMFMLVASTGVSMWLFLAARRELKSLDRLAEEMLQEPDEAEVPKKKKTSKRR